MRILSVIGTRPEAIKMAPVIRALYNHTAITSLVCVTGQHRDMLSPVLDLFGVIPDYDLETMTPGQTLNGLMAAVLSGMDDVITEARPDRILVHGDTTTAMAAAMAAFHRGVPVGHVEAGLRTYDVSRPWPEEMNRRVVDLTADLLFAPTPVAKRNLEGEALQGRILVTGNTVVDALLSVVGRLDREPELCLAAQIALPRLRNGRKVILVTGHRRESFGDGFRDICAALAELALRQDVEIVYPVHLNPNVQEPVRKMLAGRDNIHLTPPLDYLQFVSLMRRADLVLTDSGGVQEEAPSLGKPVLVMRDVTERPEAVAAGAVKLVGTDPRKIVDGVAGVLDGGLSLKAFGAAANPYGDGNASARIVDGLLSLPVEEFDPSEIAAARMVA